MILTTKNKTNRNRTGLRKAIINIIPAALTLFIIVVVFWLYAIPFMKEQFMVSKKNLIREQTNTAWSVLNNLHNQSQEENIDKQNVQIQAKKIIRDLRYGPEGKDYFWIIDREPNMIMHPYIPSLIGKDVSNYQDPEGKRLFAEMVVAVEENGSGFVGYHWQWKDSVGHTAPKISYVRLFKPWGWVIGTGLYVNDVEESIAEIVSTANHVFLAVGIIVLMITILISIQNIRREKLREKTENDLVLEKENLRITFNSIGDAVIVTDTNAQVTRMNPIARELTGFSLQEAVGKPISDIFRIFSNKTGEKVENPVKKVLREGKIVGLANHTKLVNPQGYEYQIADSGAPIKNAQGLITGVVLVFRDVTHDYKIKEELRNSEERFKLAVEGSRDGLWDWDLTTGKAYHSPQFARMLGYKPRELPYTSKAWSDLLHPEDADKAMNDVKEYLKGTKPYYESTFRMRAKNGDYRWITGRGKALFDEDDKPIRFVGFNTDVTGQKENEKALLEAKEKAEESDRLKTAFLANISHEIRTPMNGILGFTRLLRKQGISAEKQQDFIQIIEKSGRRMLRTINDLVSIAKIEAGQVNISLESMNLNELVTDLVVFFKADAETKGIDLIITQSGEDADAEIISDRDKISSVLSNLIYNAIKFTDHGSVEIQYSLENKQIHFCVSDTGIGIEKSRLKAIFERFVQADIEDKEVREGTGLGLSISKSYIEMLNGKMWVNSVLGEGSEFHFIIPYK